MNTDIRQLLDKMAAELESLIAARSMDSPAMVGIHTGGVWIAKELHQRLKLAKPLGALNISFYRDDFTQTGLHPSVSPSELPFQVEGEDIILVDDVLMTGRTIRAALNEIFDYGRPSSVTLAVLYDLNSAELPIRANIVGETLALSPKERVKLSGPDPLQAAITSIS